MYRPNNNNVLLEFAMLFMNLIGFVNIKDNKISKIIYIKVNVHFKISFIIPPKRNITTNTNIQIERSKINS